MEVLFAIVALSGVAFAVGCPRAPAWMYGRGPSDDSMLTAGELTTYREVLLRPGDRVSVLGRATLEI